MEYYNYGQEIKNADLEIAQNLPSLPNSSVENLQDLIALEPEKLALVVVKPLDISEYYTVKNWIESKIPDAKVVFTKGKKLISSEVEILYSEMVNDRLFFPKMNHYLTNYTSLFLVVRGRDISTQTQINQLKQTRVNSKREDGESRAYLRGAKYSYDIYKKWLQGETNLEKRVFDENTQLLLSRNYILGNGIHTPDTNEEAVKVIKQILLA